EQQLIFKGDAVSVFADSPATFTPAKSGVALAEVIAAQLSQVRPHDYVALTAYIEENPAHEALIQQIRHAIRDRWKVATTTGYGPRFLHSTGQLHKGGADNGVFLQITAHPSGDLNIPGEAFSFG